MSTGGLSVGKTVVLMLVIFAVFSGAYVVLMQKHEREVTSLQTLSRDLLLLAARDNEVYRAFMAAFPDATVHDTPVFPKESRSAEDTVGVGIVKTVGGGELPEETYLCTISPRRTGSGLEVDIRVTRMVLEMSGHSISQKPSGPVSLSELRAMAGPTTRPG